MTAIDVSAARGREVTREELYAFVWASPLADVAKSFGVTDVELAAMCRNLNVPIPSRDHWSTLAAGAQPKVWPLPRTAKKRVATIGARQSASPPPPPVAKASRTEGTGVTSAEPVTLPDSAGKPHPLTKQTRKHFDDMLRRLQRYAKRGPNGPYISGEWPPSDDRGRYCCAGDDGYALTTSFEQLDRALALLDALTKELARLRFKFSFKVPSQRFHYGHEQPGLVVEKDGEEFRYRLWESYSQQRHSAKKLADAKRTNDYIGKVSYIPNGTFVFELKGTEYRIERTFRESPGNTLDQSLPDLVRAFVDAIPRQKALRDERLAMERARQLAEQRRRDEENRIRQEQQQVESLLDEASRARRFAELRSYLDSVEREATQRGGITEARLKWLGEARRLIELYDPMQARLGPKPCSHFDDGAATT